MAKRRAQASMDRTGTHSTDTSDVLEPVSAAAVVLTGLIHLNDMLEKRREQFDPKRPLSVAIEDSRSDSTSHTLLVAARSDGRHGVYLESLALDESKATLKVALHSERGISFGGEGLRRGEALTVAPSALPLHLLPDMSVRITVAIPRLEPKRLGRKPFGTLRLTCLVLGIAEGPVDLQIPFAVRP